MNFVDFLFLVLLVAMLAAGFFQGMIRLTIVLVAFYLSTVLASLYFPAVGAFFQRNFGTERFAADYIAFTVVLVVSFILLTIAGLYTFRYAKMPGQLQYLDRFGGVLLGVILAGLFIGVFSVLLWDIMIVGRGESVDWPLMRSFGRSIRTSFLLGYFTNVILPETYALISPILPEGASRIFIIPR